MTDNMVFSFFENAYNTMNNSEQTDSPKCSKCHTKDPVLSEFHKIIKTKRQPQWKSKKLKKTYELNAQIAAIITRQHLYVLSVMINSELTKSSNSTYRNCVSRVHLKKQCINTMMKYIMRMSTCVQCVQVLQTSKDHWPIIST